MLAIRNLILQHLISEERESDRFRDSVRERQSVCVCVCVCVRESEKERDSV